MGQNVHKSLKREPHCCDSATFVESCAKLLPLKRQDARFLYLWFSHFPGCREPLARLDSARQMFTLLLQRMLASAVPVLNFEP